jgi:hypothetical protein
MRIKIKLKKIIAREFLILITILSIWLICYLMILLYNTNLKNKIEHQIQEKSKLTVLLYKLKLESYKKTKDVYDLYPLGYFKNLDEFKKYVTDTNNIKDCFELLPVGYFRDKGEFSKYIQSLNFKNEDIYIKKINELKNKNIKIQDEILTNEELNILLKLIATFLFIAFYPIRYLYYIIKWSIKTLKVKIEYIKHLKK